jgi:transmembrane sensor|eukprot:gene35900-44266_t
MDAPNSADQHWQTAMDWVLRQHEASLAAAPPPAGLKEWLAADPAHRAAFEEASRVWLVTGLVPPAAG